MGRIVEKVENGLCFHAYVEDDPPEPRRPDKSFPSPPPGATASINIAKGQMVLIGPFQGVAHIRLEVGTGQVRGILAKDWPTALVGFDHAVVLPRLHDPKWNADILPMLVLRGEEQSTLTITGLS